MSAEEKGLEFLIGGDLAPLQQAIQQAEQLADKAGQKFDETNKKIEQGAQQAGKAVEGVGTSAHKAGQEAQQAGAAAAKGMQEAAAGAQQAEGAMNGLGTAARTVAASIGALGLGVLFREMTAGIGESAEKFASFQQALQQIAAVSDATSQDLDQLRARALQVGISTGLGAQQAADGMVELAKAGFTAQESMQSIEGVMALARAGGVGVAEAAELAGGALRGFGLEADQAGRVADIMAQAANKSAVDIRDLHESMKYVAPIAKASNQSIEEMSGALAIMGNQMIKGTQAGTTLRSAIERLIKPHKEGADALHELGIAVTDTAGKMLPLGDILDQLRGSLAKYNDTQKEAKLAAIFGVEALSGMMALVNAGPEAYDKMTGSMNEANGAAKKMGDTMNEGLGPALKSLNNSLDEAKLLLGEQFAPAIKITAEQLKALITWFNQLDPSTKALIAAIGASATAMVGLGAAAATAALAVGALEAVGVSVAAILGGPFGLALLAAGVAVGALTGAAIDSTNAITSQSEALDEANQAHAQTAIKAAESAEELSKLATEHDNLTDKTNLTREEQQRLHAITERLKKAYPELAAAVEAAGDSHWATLAPMQAEINKQKDLEAQTYKTLKAEMALATFLMAQAGQNAAQKHQRLSTALEGAGGADTNGGMSGARGALGVMSAQREAAQADSEYMAAAMRLASANKAIDDIDASKWTFGGSVGDVTPHGSVVAAGGHKRTPKGRKGGGGHAGTEAALDRMQLQADEKLAQEQAKIEEAAAAKRLAIAKAENDAEIAMLQQKRDAGVLTQGEYLQQFGALKAREIQLSNDAELAKIDAERKAAQAKIDAAARAVTRAQGDQGINGDQRKKLVADAQNKQADATNALAMLEEKRRTAEIQGIARITAADAAARKAQTDEAVKQNAAAEDLAKKTERANQDAANAEAENQAQTLGFYDRMAAQAALSFTKRRQEAERTYQDEQTRLIGLAMAGQNVDEAWKVMERTRAAALGGIATDEAKAATATKNAWVGGIKEIQGELTSLVSSPSLEKFADFVGGFATDPTKWDKWTSSVTKGIEAVGKFSQGADGAGGSLTDLAAAFTGLAGPVGAVVGIGLAVKGMFDDQTQAAKEYADRVRDLNVELAKLEADNEDDPFRKAEKNRDAALRKLDAEDERQRDTDAKQEADDRWWGRDDHHLQNELDRLKVYSEKRQTILKQYDDAVYAAGEPARKKAADERAAADKAAADVASGVASKAKEAAKEATDAATRAASSLADALEKSRAAQEALDAARKSKSDGGRDEYGNHTSIEAEQALKLRLQDAEYQKQRNQLLTQQKKLEEDITKTEQDRAKAVKDILDEGIAQRAKTELQDKTERIAKVNEDAAKKTTDLNQQMLDTKTALADLDDKNAKTVATINNEYKDRLTALDDEIDKQSKILVLMQQQAAAALRNIPTASGGFHEVTGDALRALDASRPHFDTGGPVPGYGPVPAVVHGGELILNQGQQGRLWSLLSGGYQLAAPSAAYLQQASAGGGGGVAATFGDIHIHNAPGASPAEQARNVRAALDRSFGDLIRQRGGLRI